MWIYISFIIVKGSSVEEWVRDYVILEFICLVFGSRVIVYFLSVRFVFFNIVFSGFVSR